MIHLNSLKSDRDTRDIKINQTFSYLCFRPHILHHLTLFPYCLLTIFFPPPAHPIFFIRLTFFLTFILYLTFSSSLFFPYCSKYLTFFSSLFHTLFLACTNIFFSFFHTTAILQANFERTVDSNILNIQPIQVNPRAQRDRIVVNLNILSIIKQITP